MNATTPLRTTLVGCGAAAQRLYRKPLQKLQRQGILRVTGLVSGTGGLLALAWVAVKVGALSYGGGFVIIPLMQHDAVDTYHWMTDGQFLNAVHATRYASSPVARPARCCTNVVAARPSPATDRTFSTRG